MSGYLHESVVELDSSNKNVSPGPGERLRKCRESLGFTHADVAAHLNLRISIIEGIEEDNYSRIPKLVFARGYLRSYAKMLKLPGNEIIEAFNKLEYPENQSDVPAAPIREGQKKALKKEHSFKPWITLIALVILFVVVGFWSSITHFVTNIASSTLEDSSSVSKETPSVARARPADLPQAQESSTDSTSNATATSNTDEASQESSSALPDINQVSQDVQFKQET